MALAVVLPAAQLVSPACCERSSTLYPQLPTVVLVALHWLADMEGNANRYDTNEVSDDEEEDFMDLVSPYKPLYAANSHNVGRNTRAAARQLVQQHQQQPIACTTQPPNPREPPPAQQQQQQSSPTAPADVNSDVCVAIISRGPNKGNVCGNKQGNRVPGLCRHHDGKQKRHKTTSGAALCVGTGDEEANYDSENELGGGVDELQTPGAKPALNKSKDAHYKKADSIADPGFKAAQRSVWHLKKKLSPKPKVSLMQQ